MHSTARLYATTHRQTPTTSANPERRFSDGMRRVPDATEPFMFTRLFLVIGVLLAAVVFGGLISG
jgi:hypothetical protein